jgi:hypothetical protein
MFLHNQISAKTALINKYLKTIAWVSSHAYTSNINSSPILVYN